MTENERDLLYTCRAAIQVVVSVAIDESALPKPKVVVEYCRSSQVIDFERPL